MLRIVNRAKRVLGRVHRNEDGMEALQVVLIIALAAIILAFAYKMFGGESDNETDTGEGSNGNVVKWVREVMDNIFNWK